MLGITINNKNTSNRKHLLGLSRDWGGSKDDRSSLVSTVIRKTRSNAKLLFKTARASDSEDSVGFGGGSEGEMVGTGVTLDSTRRRLDSEEFDDFSVLLPMTDLQQDNKS